MTDTKPEEWETVTVTALPLGWLNVYRSDPAQQNRLNVRPVGWRAMPAGGVTSRSATASRVRSQSARPLQSVSAWAKEHV